MNNSQRDAIAFLGNPDSYAPKPDSVERRETHGAIVFLAGERAYKLKRAVRYPYMDYSTIDARRLMCEREMAVNRRTAPAIYLDVRPLVRSADNRIRFGKSEEDHAAVDWVVVMRRFPEGNLLEEMRRRGEITPALMRRLGEEIAGFHSKAEVTCRYGGAQAIRAVLEENTLLLRQYGLDAEKVERLNALSCGVLEKLAGLLDRRCDEGRVRRCHGDLHLNNICLIEGKPVLFDAIEFNDAFSCIDVLYDISFLLMDLMRHRLDSRAEVLLNRYLELTRDYDGLAALPLFLSCRAAITAHVTMSRARETAVRNRAKEVQSEACQLLDFALACFARGPSRLVAIGGISGTGKSTLAYRIAETLAPAPGAIVLRTDIIRKRTLGVADDERLAESAYSRDMHDRVYADLAKHAASILAGGYSVVVDAVFGQPREQSGIARVATDRNIPFWGLWLEAPTDIIKGRIAERRGDASDATMGIVDSQVAQAKMPSGWTRIDASGAPEQTFALANASRLNAH
jgi:aminoglycoside phosphotransferase family enzyme/predicted kinase